MHPLMDERAEAAPDLIYAYLGDLRCASEGSPTHLQVGYSLHRLLTESQHPAGHCLTSQVVHLSVILQHDVEYEVGIARVCVVTVSVPVGGT